MSDQYPPQPPSWGQPGYRSPSPPPLGPPTPKRRTGLILAVAGGGLVLVLVIAALAGNDPGTTSSAPVTTSAAVEANPSATELEEPATSAERQQKPATAKVGQTIQFEDGFGDHSADVTVARKKVSTGDQFNEPNGVYVGFLVRVKAFQDGITVPDFYVVAGGKRFESHACCPDGFEPSMDVYEVNQGETAEGWMLFEVPSSHGRLIMKEFLSDEPQATWAF
jgi:hypothetical protein